MTASDVRPVNHLTFTHPPSRPMEPLLKELGTLEQAAECRGKGKAPSISDSINGLVSFLESVKASGVPVNRSAVLRQLEMKKKDIDDRQKEVYASMSRLGKAIDKKFTVPVPAVPNKFAEDQSVHALEETIVQYLLRTGQFDAAETLARESDANVPGDMRASFQKMHTILSFLRTGDVQPALQWAQEHEDFLHSRGSPLEFYLHRSQYLRLLLHSDPPEVAQAITYAHMSLAPFYHEHVEEVKRLMTCIIYLPASRLRHSPYADLTSPEIHTEVEPLFAKEFCASLGLSQQVPLETVTRIGGGGALAKIEKARRVLKETKTEWSQEDEVPIELAIAPEHRYHSIFTCPVSKEQSTLGNPPMMMTCGHVIAKDSLNKISKPLGGIGRVKCPYCPNESSPTAAVAPTDLSQSVASLGASQSSSAPVPELSGLTPADVELIDVIITRAGDAASSFFPVFKAYSDILQERGLDPHEVVYYGKLLKLGTLKGRNWADKWSMVKKRYGYGTATSNTKPTASRPTQGAPAPTRTGPSRQAPSRRTPVPVPVPVPSQARRAPLARLAELGRPRQAPTNARPIVRDDDSFTLHSHADDAESVPEAPTPRIEVPHTALARARARQRRLPALSDATSNSLGLDFGDSASQAPAARRRRFEPIPSETDDDDDALSQFAPPSTTPPSYNAAARDILLGKQNAVDAKTRLASVIAKPTPPPAPVVSAINEEDAWKKIKMAQDEKDADEYYRLRVMERCFGMWSEVYQWIVTTHRQVQEAREALILQIYYRRWRDRLASKQVHVRTQLARADLFFLRTALIAWRRHLVQRQHANWRDAMRGKMRLVRQKRDERLKKEVMVVWRQARQDLAADDHYNRQLVRRAFTRWQKRLVSIDQLEDLADQYQENELFRIMDSCWANWRLRIAEATMARQVGARLQREAMSRWLKRLNNVCIADRFYDRIILKNAVTRWQGSLAGVRKLEKRATRHVARQDDVLLLAVFRVWKARELGVLLERVTARRIQKRMLAVWVTRLAQVRKKETLALRFASQSRWPLVNAFQTWRTGLQVIRVGEQTAIRHHTIQLQSKIWIEWLGQLQEHNAITKKARLTELYFLMRRTWGRMQAVHRERALQRKLRKFNDKKADKIFVDWMLRAQKQRRLRTAEKIVSTTVRVRILGDILAQWTDRVIEIKEREIEVRQRYEIGLLVNAFTKWKHICLRHVEDLSLMESYREVKREDQVRRMFFQWLSAARAARHRKLLLQRLEDEKKLTLLSGAWERWTEKFRDQQLRPLEYQFLYTSQKSTLRNAMEKWKSRTKAFPAIRFHATNVKARTWEAWRKQMPLAQLARKAREFDQKHTLARFFDELIQAYRTKLTRKAVDRARKLRLPTAPSASRATGLLRPVPEIAAPAPLRGLFPRRPLITTPPEDMDEPAPSEREPSPPPSRLFGVSRRTAFPTRPRAEVSPTRSTGRLEVPTRRQASPTRSTRSALSTRVSRGAAFPPPPPSSVGGDEPSRLWQELRQLRSRPKSSSGARSPTRPDP
ncbi:hypothetical protein CYLTODRAFT_442301 [Cylindrobasidium torrendii FP15055 ss-10]|uniref:GID complex catalytic subunit 2 n=1 Tax=Cylindrobasidium torrendii FP15055 ss-10 TaxID=1314674 RepID=A0A0D7BIT2_9AGAR|nr:hypothetical protein CYLTODRAFT_442301 [Cylindrobasidium torrendii FP15055 ss-10]